MSLRKDRGVYADAAQPAREKGRVIVRGSRPPQAERRGDHVGVSEVAGESENTVNIDAEIVSVKSICIVTPNTVRHVKICCTLAAQGIRFRPHAEIHGDGAAGIIDNRAIVPTDCNPRAEVTPSKPH